MEELSPIGWAIRPLRRYADFSGRAPRAEYWWYYLATVILSIPLRLLDNMLGTNQVLSMIFNLALLLPWLAVSVRRLHDTDRSGWWLLAFVGVFAAAVLLAGMMVGIGAVGASFGRTAGTFTTLIVTALAFLAVIITWLIFMLLPGTEGPNRYGADPYGPDQLEEVFA